MLEVKVYGGLGNQMFQYAFYKYLSLKNDAKMNISDFKVHKHHHGFELERVFGIQGPYETEESPLAVKHNAFLVRLVKKLFHADMMSGNEYHEFPDISFVENRRYERDIYFCGFWQSARYLMPLENELRHDFCFPAIEGKNEELAQMLVNTDSVSLHVRRADYLSEQALSCICDRAYYDRAISAIREQVERPQFVIFSDDIEWCRENFAALDAIFVDWNIGDNSYIDMQLMSLCKHNIIANSTFSFWGAFLGNPDGRVVIMPEKWSREQSNRLILPRFTAI